MGSFVECDRQDALGQIIWSATQMRIPKGSGHYLGFEVSKEGIRTSPEKVKAILDLPRLQSTHDIRSFSELTLYYRKFIRGFSQIAKPLTDLTRDKVV